MIMRDFFYEFGSGSLIRYENILTFLSHLFVAKFSSVAFLTLAYISDLSRFGIDVAWRYH